MIHMKTTQRASLRLCALVAILLLLAPVSWAQSLVRGTVTDQNGLPLAGATIVVKGTTTGTTTDANGQFTLNLPTGGETLVFAFIGYERV